MQTPNAPRRQASCPECEWIALLNLLVRIPSVSAHIRDQKMKCREAKQLGDIPVCLPLNFSTRTLRFMRRLVHRPRRLRRSPALRNLVRETHLTVHDFVLPLFVSEKLDQRWPVASMPGVYQLPVNELVDEARRAHDLGL